MATGSAATSGEEDGDEVGGVAPAMASSGGGEARPSRCAAAALGREGDGVAAPDPDRGEEEWNMGRGVGVRGGGWLGFGGVGIG